MSAPTAVPKGSTVFWTAIVALPLLMPGARKRYGILPVILGAIGLGQVALDWLRARRRLTPSGELAAVMQDPDVARSPHLRTHLE